MPEGADPGIPFTGRGAARLLWVFTLCALAGVALFMLAGAAVMLQMVLDPVSPPSSPDVKDEGDGRSWNVLFTNAFAALFGIIGFVAWMVTLVVAGLGFGRLARPVLALSAPVAAAGVAGLGYIVAKSVSPGWALPMMILALLGLLGIVPAWLRARPAA